MGFLDGKRILVTGLLSTRSIAWGIARAASREGAELAFTYQNERVRDRVSELAKELGCDRVFPLDVTSDEEISALAPAAGARGRAPRALLQRRGAGHAALQPQGAREGEPGGLGALSGRRARPQGS